MTNEESKIPPAQSGESCLNPLSPAEGLGFFRRLEQSDYVSEGDTIHAAPPWLGLIALVSLMVLIAVFLSGQAQAPITVVQLIGIILLFASLYWLLRKTISFLSELLDLVH